MNDAIKALDALSTTFATQSAKLKNIADNVDELKKQASNDDERLKELIDTYMDGAKISWAQVSSYIYSSRITLISRLGQDTCGGLHAALWCRLPKMSQQVE